MPASCVFYSQICDDGLIEYTANEYHVLLRMLQMPIYAIPGPLPDGWDKLSRDEKCNYIFETAYKVTKGAGGLEIPKDVREYHLEHLRFIDIDKPAILCHHWLTYRMELPNFHNAFADVVKNHMKDLIYPISVEPTLGMLLMQELDFISRASSVDDVASRIGISIDDAIDRMWEYAKKGFLFLK